MESPLPFEHLGPYKLIRAIGKGGMGAVFCASHVKSGERVAVKLIAEHVADEPKFRRRFAAEVESLKRLRHPGIVRLIGYGEERGRLFYSMELADGETLQSRIRREKRIAWIETIEIAIQICAALKHAHDIGVIHRDLKPANLMIDEGGRIKLVDFGIAKIFGEMGDHTAAGSVLGTADYMAPEQADGSGISQRTDLYALGSVMYTMLAGRPPFRGKNVTTVIRSLQQDPPPPLDVLFPELPDAIVHIVHDLLAKSPQNRPPTALAVLNRLRATQAGLEREQTLALEEENTGIHSVADLATDANPPPAGRTEGVHTRRIRPGDSQRSGDSSKPGGSSSDLSIGGLTSRHPDASTHATSGNAVTMFSDPAAAPGQSATDKTHPGKVSTLDGIGQPGPTREPKTHFRTAAEDEAADARRDDSAWGNALTLAGIVAVLAVMVGVVIIAFRSPDPEALFAKAEAGDRNATTAFIADHPDDPRTAGLIARLNAERLRGVEKRLRVQKRLGVKALSGAETALLEALDGRDVDPDAAAGRLESWLLLFGRTPDGQNAEDELSRWVRSEIERLTSSPSTVQWDPRAIELLTKIRNSLARDDTATSQKVLQGVIDSFDQQPWAEPAVREAREQLENLRMFSAPDDRATTPTSPRRK
ncbi:MAG: serine/threonine-protein kinase [Planctomycetota bacterium]